jgi:hypothetical protein
MITACTQSLINENPVPSLICIIKREEVTGVWEKLHNEELHNLYPSPIIIGVTKSKRMIREDHVARMTDDKCIQSFGRKT